MKHRASLPIGWTSLADTKDDRANGKTDVSLPLV